MKPFQSTITSYMHSTGDVASVCKGSLPRTSMTTSEYDFKQLFHDAPSLIVVPRIVGIYQQSAPAHEKPEEKRQREDILRRMNEIMDADITRIWNVRDPLHRDLIHIGYDQRTLTPELISTLVTDPLKRVRVTPLDQLPNFFEKDLTLFDQVLMEYGKRRETIDPDRENVAKHKAVLDELRPQLESVKESWKQFGLTREEWYYLHSSDIFDTHNLRN